MHSTARVSVSAAARMLNVSASTVQRLCNRGLLEYESTQGGHRRIPMREVATLIERLRGKSADGFLTSTSELTVQRVSELLLHGAQHELLEWLKHSEKDPPGLVNKLEHVFHAAIIELDARFMSSQLRSHEIWLAINTARVVLERLAVQIEVSTSSPIKAVGGSVGEHGELGTYYVEVGLRLCGMQAVGLGAELTVSALADAARHMDAQLVWVGHTHIASGSETIAWHWRLSQQLPEHVRVLIGGGALSPSIRRQLPPHTYYESIAAMVAGESLQAKKLFLAGPHFGLNPPVVNSFAAL